MLQTVMLNTTTLNCPWTIMAAETTMGSLIKTIRASVMHLRIVGRQYALRRLLERQTFR